MGRHGRPRGIDILVLPEDLPLAMEVVRPLGYVFAALPIVFEEGTDRERHVQRVSKIVGGEHLVLDTFCWPPPPSSVFWTIASSSPSRKDRWSSCPAPPSST
jgi:hypothetical protein